jgi:hypothetical protein
MFSSPALAQLEPSLGAVWRTGPRVGAPFLFNEVRVHACSLRVRYMEQ